MDDLTEELIDYEPKQNNPGDSRSLDAPESGRRGRRQYDASPTTSDGPEPDGWPYGAISDAASDFPPSSTIGQYSPTKLAPYAPAGRPASDGPSLEHRHRRHRPEQSPHESAFAASGIRPLITDVRPPVKERLAVAEHEINDLNSLYGSLYERTSQAASHSDMREHFRDFDEQLNRRFNSVHKRIDTEINPAIKSLQTKRIIRDWAVSISLAVSIIYSVVLTVKHLLQ